MSTKRFAVVENGTVSNVILWDGEDAWTPPDGTQTVQLADTDIAGPGFSYDGSAFIAPPPVKFPWET
ncbi:hypothetical protein [Paraburkholderia tropica]|uniref:hypothetical protein n=1 Tax=Paraburkholderia tropica TaxID=92647 RepID=UPI003D2D730D